MTTSKTMYIIRTYYLLSTRMMVKKGSLRWHKLPSRWKSKKQKETVWIGDEVIALREWRWSLVCLDTMRGSALQSDSQWPAMEPNGPMVTKGRMKRNYGYGKMFQTCWNRQTHWFGLWNQAPFLNKTQGGSSLFRCLRFPSLRKLVLPRVGIWGRKILKLI